VHQILQATNNIISFPHIILLWKNKMFFFFPLQILLLRKVLVCLFCFVMFRSPKPGEGPQLCSGYPGCALIALEWMGVHQGDFPIIRSALKSYWILSNLEIVIGNSIQIKIKSWFSLILTFVDINFSVVNCIELFKNYGWKFYKHRNYKNILIIPPPPPPAPPPPSLKTQH
jgi:hypothetical protein